MQAVVAHAQYMPSSEANSHPNSSYYDPRAVIEERNLDTLAPGELRIEMDRVGICGSDLGIMQTDPDTGSIRSSVPLSIPAGGRVLGHEGIGVVREVGSAVSGFQPGDWVTLESLISCHQCIPCRRGDFNQCLNASLVGFQCDGIFSEVSDVPAQLAHGIGDMAGSEDGRRAAACVEPAACALVGLQSATLQPGKNVLIFGAGPIGVFAAMLCRYAFSAASVHVVEPVAFRRQFAKQWADKVWDTQEFLDARDAFNFDLLLEASGALASVDASMRCMSANASIVLLARGTEPLLLQTVDHIVTNGITIVGSRGHLGGAFDTVLSLWASGRLPLHDAVTGVKQGLNAICQSLQQPEKLLDEHCKLQVRI